MADEMRHIVGECLANDRPGRREAALALPRFSALSGLTLSEKAFVIKDARCGALTVQVFTNRDRCSFNFDAQKGPVAARHAKALSGLRTSLGRALNLAMPVPK